MRCEKFYKKMEEFMKKLLTSIVIVLFIGSLFAVESDPSEVVGYLEFSGVTGLNFISVPLDAGYVTSTDLVTPILACNQISRWDEAVQGWVSYNKSPFGTWPTSFALTPGMAVMIKLTGDEDVYVAGSLFVPEISFDLVLELNAISIPLSRSDITTSAILGTDMSDINQISRWDAGLQGWVSYNKSPFGTWPTSFVTTIGMPVMVKATSVFTWPTVVLSGGSQVQVSKKTTENTSRK
jgi:hypothetical protein